MHLPIASTVPSSGRVTSDATPAPGGGGIAGQFWCTNATDCAGLTWWPAFVTSWLDSAHDRGGPCPCTKSLSGPPLLLPKPNRTGDCRPAPGSDRVLCSGDSRCGRTHNEKPTPHPTNKRKEAGTAGAGRGGA